METLFPSRSSTLHIDTSRFCTPRVHPLPPDGTFHNRVSHSGVSYNKGTRNGATRPTVQIETLSYDADTRWSAPLPALDSEQTLLVVFGGALGNVVEPVADLVKAYPKSRLVGCSRPCNAQNVPDAVSVTFMRFSYSHLHVTYVPVTPPAAGDDVARPVGERIAKNLLAPALQGVMLFPGVPDIDSDDLLESAKAALPRTVTLTSFASGAQSCQGWAVGWGGPQRNVVAAVGLYGERVVFD